MHVYTSTGRLLVYALTPWRSLDWDLLDWDLEVFTPPYDHLHLSILCSSALLATSGPPHCKPNPPAPAQFLALHSELPLCEELHHSENWFWPRPSLTF